MLASFFMWEVSLTHPVLAFCLFVYFVVVAVVVVVAVSSFFLLQSTLKKGWVEAGPGEKCEKVTLKPEKVAPETPEQSRTKN